MQGYGTADIARLLQVSPQRVRALARSGFLRVGRDARGAYRFTFQDLVLLRTAKELSDARVPAPRIHRALRSLSRQLPADRPLSQLRIAAQGDRIVVRDGASLWHPESGQLTMDFQVSELATRVAPLARRRARAAGVARPEPLSSEDWFELGLEVEDAAPAEAVVAYRRCLAIDEHHAEAMVNLGRLVQTQGRAHEAEELYRRARAARPELAVAAFNLGTVLDELRRPAEAIEAYLAAVERDPEMADAHYNLSLLYEQGGNRIAAFRHLRRYRELTGRRKR
jgi:tetratricopeptide (TPR) repeat protein